MGRRLAAIVVADVVGYSRLLNEDEAGTLASLRERRKAVVEPLTKLHAGRVVKFLGDGVLIEFSSAVNAVTFALDLQRRMAEMNEPVAEARRIRLRVGINLGEVVGEGSDIYGDGVNIASRLEGIAEPGGVVISGKVHEEVRGKLDIRAEDLGEVALKNISSPVRCWRITAARSAMSAAQGLDNRISIAVLPFTNMSGDADQDYFVDGLTEDLITALAKFRCFSVLSRNATFQFKGRAVDIPALGRQLGVRYVLEGSVRTGSNRIRVTAQLIDVDGGTHIWAEKFDRELADVFAVQDEIVNAIVGQLMYNTVDAGVAARIGAPPATLTSYDHLLRGRSSWRRGAVLETFEHWTKAVAANPGFGPALASLGFLYSEESWMQMTGLSSAEAGRLSDEFTAKAIAADDGDEWTQQMIATALLTRGELERAKQHFELALTLNPHDPNSTINLGCTVGFLGAHKEGLRLIAKALRIDPRPPPAMLAVPFYVHCSMGDVEGAEAYFARIQDPLAYLHLLMAVCFAGAGRNVDAEHQRILFETKRRQWFDIQGLAAAFDRCLRLPEDKARLLDGFRKLGFDV